MGLNGIHAREPDKGPPSEVEAEVVVSNVNGAQVPGLIDEEVKDVHCVQNGDKNNVGIDPSMDLVLICDVGQIARFESACVKLGHSS